MTVRLTRREKEVLDHVIKGWRNKEIADAMCLSVKTIEKHRSNLNLRLGAHNGVQLLLRAIELGLVNL